ncbi:Hypothetical protein CINCED_3A016832 [Cinara cedri]|uniref:Uncharacterized protein n=1 Tax=Cinara cedri TaxID=506608 RepID=A0A5E4M7T8_9HEMI|nr:Hypothetical protein CINCED_3A016832 [Cinara cedri]
MWKSSFFVKGTVVLTIFSLLLRKANCDTYTTNSYEYSAVSVPYKPYADRILNHEYPSPGMVPDENADNDWRNSEYGGVSDRAKHPGPMDVRGGSAVRVQLQGPPPLPPVAAPEGLNVDSGGIGPKFETGLFGPPPPFASTAGLAGLLSVVGLAGLQVHPNHLQGLVGVPGSFAANAHVLLRLLYGVQQLMTNPSSVAGGFPSLCSRPVMAVVGRFLQRLLEPLFATGFYMAASYFFKRSVLPRIAHYVHVYASMKDHEHARLDGRGPLGDLNGLAATVGEAVDDRPCLQKIVCEAGLEAAKSSVARTIGR